jgi:hypothetical protein
MTSKIKKFAILGERCSGTNFLEEAMKENFHITYTAEYGNKHFFCFNNYQSIPKTKQEETLFIGIIRNPIYWLNSFSKELYHVPTKNKNINSFLFNEFYSIREQDSTLNKNTGEYFFTQKNPPEIINEQDFNPFTNAKYKNIFELRKSKNHFLTYIMPRKVKNYIFIHYEDLLFHYEETLSKIQNIFHLYAKQSSFTKIRKYKKSDTYSYINQRQITFTPGVVKKIWDNLDMQQENSLGYFMWDNNEFFRKKKNTIQKPKILEPIMNELDVPEPITKNLDIIEVETKESEIIEVEYNDPEIAEQKLKKGKKNKK